MPPKEKEPDNPHTSWLNTFMQTDETEEVKKHLKNDVVRGLLLLGKGKTNEAFKEVCLQMNSKNLKKREKWNFLGNEKPDLYAKGRSLL